MNAETPDRAGSLTLDDLAAFNHEIVALARCGVPLERGLGLVGRDLPGRLGRFATSLAEQLERGQSLEEALRRAQPRVPELYQALVAAGLRSGNLAGALEPMTETVRRVTELRRVASVALIYPVLVLLLAWGSFCFYVAVLARPMIVLDTQSPGLAAWLVEWRASVGVWGPAGAGAVLAVVAVWVWSSRRAGGVAPGIATRWARWMRGSPRVGFFSRAAVMAEVFALLVEQRVPLADALRLATAAGGDRRMREEGSQAAAAIAAGQPPAAALSACMALPQLFVGVVQNARSPAQVAGPARRVAAMYHRRAEHALDWARIYLPILLTLGLGCGAVLGYAMVVLVPWIQAMRHLLENAGGL